MEEILPGGFTVRPALLDDVIALAELRQACEIADYGESETTLEEMRHIWRMPNFDPVSDTRVVMAPDGQLIGFAQIEQQEYARIYMDGKVHPQYRGRGIGSYLMQWGEARAQQLMEKAAPDVRVTLGAHSSSANTSAQALIQEHGFTLARSFWRMGIDLKEPPAAAQWSEGIVVHTMTPGMERAVFAADDDAFRDHWGYMPEKYDEWEHGKVKRENFDPTLWFLAMDGAEIAGLGLCAVGERNETWVHVLGVRRPWRRRGIALALLLHAFGEFYKRGLSSIYLSVDAQSLTGATRLYERVGMHVVRQSDRYEKELRAGRELSTLSVEE
jgi:mycothiol synthase